MQQGSSRRDVVADGVWMGGRLAEDPVDLQLTAHGNHANALRTRFRPSASMANRASMVATSCLGAFTLGKRLVVVLATGGSAMPCGLVLPLARAKLVEAACEPEVRVVAPSYWYTRSVPLST